MRNPCCVPHLRLGAGHRDALQQHGAESHRLPGPTLCLDNQIRPCHSQRDAGLLHWGGPSPPCCVQCRDQVIWHTQFLEGLSLAGHILRPLPSLHGLQMLEALTANYFDQFV